MFCKFSYKIVMAALILMGTAKARSHSLDPRNSAEDFTNLCSLGIEGTFQGSIEKTPALFNVICLDANRMAMGINYGAQEVATAFTLINSLIDDDGTLVFSMSPLTPADRRSATSGSPTTYVRLHIGALKNGILNGIFLGGNDVRPKVVNAQRTVSLPSILSLKSIGIDPRTARGTYQFKLSNGLKLSFWFDMIAGVPVVTIFDGNKGLHLIDGPSWDGHGGFAVTDVFGDAIPASSNNLIQMRGRVAQVGELEIYYVDPLHGVQGPISAVRLK